MKILLVNDDGIQAEGLLALARALETKHEVVIVAPADEQSGKSQALSMGVSLKVKQFTAQKLHLHNVLAYSVEGTPADCTKLALEALLDEKPDLIISGINNGGNLGTDVLYSGTVGAALEGYNHGISAIAVSVPQQRSIGMQQIAEIMADNINIFYQSDKLFMYNINFPNSLKDGKVNFIATKQGYRRYENEFELLQLADDSTVYRMRGRAQDVGNDEQTDIETVKKGFISVTPLSIERTDFSKLGSLQNLLKSSF